MKKYIVQVQERYSQSILIEAENEAEAMEKVKEGDGVNLGESEYIDTMDECTWGVFEDEDA